MSELKQISGARYGDIQTVIQAFGAIIMGIGFWMLGTSAPWLLAVIFIGYGLGFQFLSRRFEANRVKIRYGGNPFSRRN